MNEAGVLWTTNANTVPGSWFGSVLKTNLSVSSRVTTRTYCNQLTACPLNHCYRPVSHQSQLFSPRGRPFKYDSLLNHNCSNAKSATYCCWKACHHHLHHHPSLFSGVLSGLKVKKLYPLLLLRAYSHMPWGFLHFAPRFGSARCLVNSGSILKVEPSALSLTVFHFIQ